VGLLDALQVYGNHDVSRRRVSYVFKAGLWRVSRMPPFAGGAAQKMHGIFTQGQQKLL